MLRFLVGVVVAAILGGCVWTYEDHHRGERADAIVCASFGCVVNVVEDGVLGRGCLELRWITSWLLMRTVPLWTWRLGVLLTGTFGCGMDEWVLGALG